MDNTHEKMRILEMVRKGLITTQEGVLRIRAIEKQVATTKVHYNVFEWRKLVLHPATHPMKILYFGNGDLCRNGVSVLQVTYGDHYKFSTDGCIIDPCCPEHYERLLIDAGAWEQEISILHSWANGEYVGAKEIIDRQKQLSVESIFHLVKALLHGGMKRRCNIVFRYPISADGKVNPIFAAVGSFARVAYNENPNINIKVVAQEPEGDPEQCFGAFNAEGSEFRLYGGCLYGKSFRETSIDTAVEYKPTHGDVYLITGGAGGLGKMFAKSLAERYEAKLVLIGRSPISDSVKSLLTQIEQLGGEAVYLSADVSDFSSVKDAVAQARARFGHVNGVIHAAGVILDSFIYNKSIEDWNAVLAPKIYGTAALLEATSNDKLKFFVTFSSIAAQIGGIGQADYAYANGFMDSLMVQCFDANLSCRYLSINWPLWRDGGMKADKRLVEMAEGTSMFNMLESHQGIEDFYKMLGIDEKQIMVVVDNENRSEQSVKSQQIVIDRKIECSDEVKQKTYEYLMELIELETGNAKGRINGKVAFSDLGIDSVMIMSITQKLERKFGSLSKTLFFENRTVSELTDYFVNNHSAILNEMFGREAVIQQKPSVDNLKPKEIEPVVQPKIITPQSLPASRVKAEPKEERIDLAVIGMAGQYPKSKDLLAFWHNLVDGVDCITEVPKSRWDVNSEAMKGCSHFGGFIDDIDKFDPLFFKISPREAEVIDPQERLFLQTTWHTLEDAGYSRSALAGKNIGVFVGVMWGQYQLYGVENTVLGEPMALASNFASVPNRVSYFFDFRGPSVAFDTMCSSSLTALHYACESIRNGDCEAAIVGGVNLATHPSKYMLLKQGNYTSSDGHCRSFGEGGDGYVPGEGVGAVLIKPLKKAIIDGDSIYGVIKGTALNHGGKTNGFTVPDPMQQSNVICKAIERSGVLAETINYIEAHGTGTSLGDPIEIRGIVSAFGKMCSEDRTSLSIGSVKSNIGHLEGAAGIAALQKVMLQLRYGMLVPSLHSEVLNQHLDWGRANIRIQQNCETWKRCNPSIPRRAGISAFGAGGANAHLIVEEYVRDEPEQKEEAKVSAPQIVVLSARNKQSLHLYAERLLEYITEPNVEFTVESTELYDKCIEYLRDRFAAQFSVSVNDIDCDAPLTEYGIDQVSASVIENALEQEFGTIPTGCVLNEDATISSIAKTVCKSKKAFLIPTEKKLSLSSIAYTLARREKLSSRLAVVADGVDNLAEKLRAYLNGTVVNGVAIGDDSNVQQGMAIALDNSDGQAFVNSLIEKHNLLPIAHFWVSGAEIDLNSLVSDSIDRDLPKYPFEKQSYWVHRAKRIVEVLDEPQITLLRKEWKKVEKTRPVSLGSNPIAILVNHHNSSSVRSAVNKLPFDSIILEIAEDQIENAGILRYNDMSGRVAAKSITAVSGIVDLSDIGLPYSSREEKLPLGKIAFLQEIIATLKEELRVLHFTSGLKNINGTSSTVYGAAFDTFVRVVGSEYSKVSAVCVDTDCFTDDTDVLARLISQAMLENCDVCELKESDGKWFTPVMLPFIDDSQPVVIDSDKAVIITGGTGGLGLMSARYLLRRGVRKMALMGITPLPPRDIWNNVNPGDKLYRKLHSIMELEEMGASVMLYNGDLTNRVKVADFINRVRSEWGAIGGLVHCAGVSGISGSPAFARKTSEDICRVFRPKLDGLQTVSSLIAEDRPNFVMLYSSVSAVAPSLGNGMSDYAAANSCLDSFANCSPFGNETTVYSVNWCSFENIGMGETISPLYRKLGLRTVNTDNGERMLDAILAHSQGGVVMPCIIEKDVFDGEAFLKTRPLKTMETEPIHSPLKNDDNQNQNDNRLMDKLKKIFMRELKLPENAVDIDTPFGDYGVDSILLAELVSVLERELSVTIEPSALIEYQTLRKLTGYISALIPDSEKTNSNVQLKQVEQPVQSETSLKSTSTVQSITENKFKNRKVIAVVGVGCNFPCSGNKDIFWNNLINGVDCITEVPRTRWNAEQYFKDGRIISKWGGFIDDIEYFDPDYFNIDRDVAVQMDPLIKQVLEVSVQTLRDAGYNDRDLWGENIGVYIGSRAGNYANRIKHPIKNTIIGVGQNFIAAHVSHFFNWTGPNTVIDSACSSSLVSISLACDALINGRADAALAGGVDILLDENVHVTLSEGKALSADGRCHTFDRKANGFVPGEGCGLVLLKLLDKALTDGDQIYSVILSTAVNNDGHTMGITTPNPDMQEAVIADAVKRAEISPNDYSYIEAHGTGTLIGDPIELRALTNVFRKYTSEKQFCAIGSVKSNMGHLLSAAGVSGFIKTVLSIKNRMVPPTLHCEEPNPRFRFEDSPFRINTTLKKWDKRNGRLVAGVSSFGFGGTNAHIILEALDDQRDPEQIRKPLPLQKFNKIRCWLDKTEISHSAMSDNQMINEKKTPRLLNIIDTTQENVKNVAPASPMKRLYVLTDTTQEISYQDSDSSQSKRILTITDITKE